MSSISVAAKMAEWDPNEETRTETLRLVEAAKGGDADAAAEVEERFGSRLAFGTAGLRGPMGVGSNRMNEAVVIQSTQVSIGLQHGPPGAPVV